MSPTNHAGPIPGATAQPVLQGEFRVATDPETVFTTVLGSCVATCICDPVNGIGGMNHFLLPGQGQRDQASLRYGVNAMELMINALLKQGARRDRLEAKLFGGARMLEGLSNIGASNAEFALWFLQVEGIRCVGKSLGGEKARKVRYWPHSGQAQQQFVRAARDPLSAVAAAPAPRRAQRPDDITLF